MLTGWPPTTAHAPGGAHPGDARPAARGHRRLPGRARLRRYVDHAGLRAGRGQPRRPAAPLPDQERPGRGRRRAPHRGPRRGAAGRRRRAAARRSAAPARCSRCSPTTSPRRSSAPRSSSGWRPAPTRRCSRRSSRSSSGSAARRTGSPSTRSAPTSPAPGVRELVQATLDLVRGLGLANTITDDARRRGRILDQWARTLDDALKEPRVSDLLETLLADLTAEGDQLWTAVVRPRRRRLGHAHARRRLDRRDPGRPPALDRRGRDHRGHRQGEVGRDRAGGDRRPRPATSTPAPTRSPGCSRRRCSPAGAPPAPRWPRRCAAIPEGQKMPWFGPPMSPTSMATARFMETWAHALDVYDALGVHPEPTDRIRHVAHLGVRTRDFAFGVHELDAARRGVPGRADRARPASVWTWGPDDAAQRVTGSAYDFCLLVTQRVHRDDTDLVAEGADAEQWLDHRAGLRRPAGRGAGAADERPSGSATAPASTATGSPRCARCSRADELDVLTGDYLAELTMLILGKDTMKDASLGYARTFVTPGRGLPRPGPGEGREDRQQRRRPQPRRPRRPAPRGRDRARPGREDRARRGRRRRGQPRVRGQRAHRQRLPRRLRHRRRARRRAPTSSSPAGSPTRRSWSGRRSRTTAGRRRRTTSWPAPSSPGHVLECGTQATGGNFSGFRSLGARRHAAGLPARRDRRRRQQRDHQARRHRRRGHRRHRDRAAGLRDPDQPLPQPRRHHPPRLDHARPRTATDRVAITGVRGEAPPERLKVCVNELGGFRNSMEFVLTGLDLDAKADWLRAPARAAR